MTDRMTCGQLVQLRKSANLTQTELADLLAVSRQTIVHWEHHKSGFIPETAQQRLRELKTARQNGLKRIGRDLRRPPGRPPKHNDRVFMTRAKADAEYTPFTCQVLSTTAHLKPYTRDEWED